MPSDIRILSPGEELTLLEGAQCDHCNDLLQPDDEEVQYVLLELPPDVYTGAMQPGAKLSLQDLDTSTPTLSINESISVQGAFEETVGSVMLLQHTPQQQQQQLGEGSNDRDEDGEGGSNKQQNGVQHKPIVCAGLSEMKLVFKESKAAVKANGVGTGREAKLLGGDIVDAAADS